MTSCKDFTMAPTKLGSSVPIGNGVSKVQEQNKVVESMIGLSKERKRIKRLDLLGKGIKA